MILAVILLAIAGFILLLAWSAARQAGHSDAREIMLRCPRCGMMVLESPERVGVPMAHVCRREGHK